MKKMIDDIMSKDDDLDVDEFSDLLDLIHDDSDGFDESDWSKTKKMILSSFDSGESSKKN